MGSLTPDEAAKAARDYVVRWYATHPEVMNKLKTDYGVSDDDLVQYALTGDKTPIFARCLRSQTIKGRT